MSYETGRNSWNGIRVRKDGSKEGSVIKDWNSFQRILTVKMDDGSVEKIVMENTKLSPPELKQWEWWLEKCPVSVCNNSWLSFGD